MKRKGRREEGQRDGERENSGSFCRIFAQEFSGTMEPFRFDELWILRDLKSCAPATNSECRHDVRKSRPRLKINCRYFEREDDEN